MFGRYSLLALLVSLFATAVCAGDQQEERLWQAARRGDVATVRSLLADGVAPNAATQYGMTALSFAADKGHSEVVAALLMAGANVNVKDSFYSLSPLALATLNNHKAVVALLMQHGASDAETWLRHAAAVGSADVVKAFLDSGRVEPSWLAAAKVQAEGNEHTEAVQLLEQAAGSELPGPRRAAPNVLNRYVGEYVNDDPQDLQVTGEEGHLVLRAPGRWPLRLFAQNDDVFVSGVNTIRFQAEGVSIRGLQWSSPFRTSTFRRVATAPSADTAVARASPLPGEAQPLLDRPFSEIDWPSFRGEGARGISASRTSPTSWNVEGGVGVRWKTSIPGLAHSSPIVWRDRVFVTTSISSGGNNEVRIGLYGATNAVEDDSEHTWRIYCLDKSTGSVLWERTADQGLPPVKRHMKGSQANSTPATNGRCVVAVFASGGLYCYGIEGQLRWKRRLGVLDSGAFYDPDEQWGFGSSPIIYKDTVIVQCDLQQGSFIAAYSLKDGREIWKSDRDEIPSWGTPTIAQTSRGAVLVTNATRFVRGYHPGTGAEQWRLAGNSEISVPTPFAAHDLIFVTSGYRPIQPIYAVRPGARGDISLDTGEESNEFIAWSKSRGGPYLPSPIAYGGYFYTCANNGILSCYRAESGELVYRKRFGRGEATSFAASPVAAAGKLYLTAEAGVVYVVRAGPQFELLTENPTGEYCLATPAISQGMLLLRSQAHVIAIGGEDASRN